MVTGVRNVLTSQMTAVELARVFADHHGYEVRWNWIYDSKSTPVACGWGEFARILQRFGYIEVGLGVHWRRADLTPPRRVIGAYRRPRLATR